MVSKKTLALVVVCFAFSITNADGQDARVWIDSSGHYTVKANLIAYDNEHVVLEKENDELISISNSDLSEKDQEFLKSEQAKEHLDASADSFKTWTMKSGLKVKALVVDFAERQITIHRHRAKVYIDDRPLTNLPPIYQEMLPKIVSHLEQKEIEGEKGMEKWIRRQPRTTKTFDLQGVLLELKNGDRYAVPFFFLSEANQKELEPGWNRWLAANEDLETRDKEAFYLRAQAQANAENVERMRQVAEVNLQLQAYDAGLFDLWEVTLYPPRGGMPKKVVVPGKDSRQATSAALQKHPNARVGGVAKVRRRNGRR